MKLTIDDYYNLVSDLMPKKEFEDRISSYNERYDELLSEEVLAFLIVDELGRNITNFSKLSGLKPGARASLFAMVVSPEPKLFSTKKDNRHGAEIYLSDPTGNCRLLLWDTRHVELVENKKIKVGLKLKILNAKVNKSNYGLDLVLDRYESLSLDPPDYPDDEEYNEAIEILDIASIEDDGPVNVAGTIAWKSPIRTFNRKNNSTGQVLNLELYDGTGSIRITLWDDFAKAAEEYTIGDQLKIINGYSKLHDSKREIHTNYRTKVILNTEGEK